MRQHLVGLVLVVAFVAACGPGTPKRATPIPAATADVAPTRPPRARFEGPFVPLAREFEMKGYARVGVTGTDLVLALTRTRWSEMEMDAGRRFREGHADLEIETDEGTRTLRIDMDDHATAGRWDIQVTFVGDMPGARMGRAEPYAKLIVRNLR